MSSAVFNLAPSVLASVVFHSFCMTPQSSFLFVIAWLSATVHLVTLFLWVWFHCDGHEQFPLDWSLDLEIAYGTAAFRVVSHGSVSAGDNDDVLYFAYVSN